MVDNNPASPFANRHVCFLERLRSERADSLHLLHRRRRTWSAPVNVTATFIRNVQITGDQANGDVYIAGMDEMGGGLTNRANKIYRSTDGGDTWTNTYTGPTFPGPGRSASGFFATMYGNPAYWRHMGWGQTCRSQRHS